GVARHPLLFAVELVDRVVVELPEHGGADRIYFDAVRRATGLLLAPVLALAGGAVRAAPARTGSRSGAAALGEAYRAFRDGDYQSSLELARKIDRRTIVNRDYVAYLAAQSAYL